MLILDHVLFGIRDPLAAIEVPIERLRLGEQGEVGVLVVFIEPECLVLIRTCFEVGLV